MSSQQTCSYLLRNLNPVLCSHPWVFDHIANDTPLDLDRATLFALVQEAEGNTLIRRASAVTQSAPTLRPTFAKITLQVCSDLEAVGLTAAVAQALTNIDMCANVVAAALHDHIFVPYERRFEAIECLEALSFSAQQLHPED